MVSKLRERARTLPLTSLIQIPDYRMLWSASFGWYAWRYVDVVVTGWLALALTGSPFFLAIIGACRTLPLLVLGIVGGILAGRFPRRGIMQVSIAFCILVAIGLIVITVTDAVQPWHLVAATLASSALWALSFPAQRSLIAETVAGRVNVTNALAFDNFGFVGANLIFSALAGAAIPLTGPQGGYAIGLIALILGLPCLAAIRGLGSAKLGEHPADAMRETYRSVLSKPVVAGVIVISIAMNGFALPLIQFLPLFARDVLNVGPAELGLLVSVWGGGAFIGNIALFLTTPRNGGMLFILGTFGAATAMLAFTFVTYYPMALLLLLVGGSMMALFGTYQSSLLIEAAGLAGRAKALGSLTVAIGVQPIGVLAIGALASSFDESRVLQFWAGLSVLMVLVIALTFSEMRTYRSRPLES